MSDPKSLLQYSKSNPELKPKKEKAKKPANLWDRPKKWPTIGDRDDKTIYGAVGRALSSWEVYEAHLSLLFGAFIEPISGGLRARQAFCSIRTHEGRLEMLRAAGEAYFNDWPQKEWEKDLENIVKYDREWSGRRNDIAHGCIQPFWRLDGSIIDGGGYVLIPSAANSKDRSINGIPTYALLSSDINGYKSKFAELCIPVANIFILIQSKNYI